jgi:hypothetical protein
MSYVPDNLDAYYAHQAEQDRRAEMEEYSLPKGPVCEETVYPGDGVYIPEDWETVHKGCLKDYILDGHCVDEEDVYVHFALSKMEGSLE